MHRAAWYAAAERLVTGSVGRYYAFYYVDTCYYGCRVYYCSERAGFRHVVIRCEGQLSLIYWTNDAASLCIFCCSSVRNCVALCFCCHCTVVDNTWTDCSWRADCTDEFWSRQIAPTDLLH